MKQPQSFLILSRNHFSKAGPSRGRLRRAVLDLAAEEKFDLVLGSPPYFPSGTGIEADHAQKIACRFELRGDIGDYCAVAARHLNLGGWFACVFPTEQLARVESAAGKAGMAIVRRR